MTKYLSIAILLTVFLVGNAYGEDEVYYCAGIGNIGFAFDKELDKYKKQLFIEFKFKIGFDRTAKTIEIKGHPMEMNNGTYTCTAPFARIDEPNLLSCTLLFFHFSFNSDNGRFVFSSIAGYVGGDGDTISVSYGKCDKFD